MSRRDSTDAITRHSEIARTALSSGNVGHALANYLHSVELAINAYDIEHTVSGLHAAAELINGELINGHLRDINVPESLVTAEFFRVSAAALQRTSSTYVIDTTLRRLDDLPIVRQAHGSELLALLLEVADKALSEAEADIALMVLTAGRRWFPHELNVRIDDGLKKCATIFLERSRQHLRGPVIGVLARGSAYQAFHVMCTSPSLSARAVGRWGLVQVAGHAVFAEPSLPALYRVVEAAGQLAYVGQRSIS